MTPYLINLLRFAAFLIGLRMTIAGVVHDEWWLRVFGPAVAWQAFYGTHWPEDD